MNVRHLINILSLLEFAGCAAALTAILLRRQLRSYFNLSLFIGVRLISDVAMGLLIVGASHFGAKLTLVYQAYFYVYWGTYALEAILLILTVYGMYRLAMAPLPGLQRLGMLIFRWVAAISLALSVGLALGPHVSSLRFVVRVITQFQQTSSILTLCLMLFVCFAIRPMGLSFKSRVFGVSLGLVMLATTNLVTSGWISLTKDMYTLPSLANSAAVFCAFIIWAVYFILPEPRRRMIVLPTTSPFLRWNQISQVLGDDPGYVAIGGVPPEMFAEAEIEVMKRASRKMVDSTEPAPLHAQA